MTHETSKKYDLEERTFQFAIGVRDFVTLLPATTANLEYGPQLIRSASSISANYLEANDAVGRKDFLMRLRISRKEAKETALWLRLVFVGSNARLEARRQELLREATELRLILSAILNNTIRKNSVELE